MIASFDIGTKHFAVCYGDPATRTVALLDVWDIRGRTASDAVENLTARLNGVDWSGCALALIEHQMTANPTASRLMQHVHSYFRLLRPSVSVKLVGPRERNRFIGITSQMPYAKRKQASVDTALARGSLWSTGRETVAAAISTHAKKDDIADAFVQMLLFVD